MKNLKYLIVVIGLSACAEEAPIQSNGPAIAVHSLKDAEHNFYIDRDCDSMFEHSSPSAGTSFDYQLTDVNGAPLPRVTRTETILRQTGDVIEYSESLSIPGAGASPPETRRVRTVLLPLSGPGMEIAFLGGGKEPWDLAPGEATAFPIQFTASSEFGERSEKSTVAVKFVGCKMIAPNHGVISGEAVRVYRLTVPALAPPPSGAPLDMTEFEWAISDRGGWRVIERSPSATTMVVRIGR